MALKSLLPFQGLRSGDDTSSLSSSAGRIQFVLCLTSLFDGGVSCANEGLVPPLPSLQQPGCSCSTSAWTAPSFPSAVQGRQAGCFGHPGEQGHPQQHRENQTGCPSCKGESKGSQNEPTVLISQAAPHSRSKSGTVCTLLILHKIRGIFFFFC